MAWQQSHQGVDIWLTNPTTTTTTTFTITIPLLLLHFFFPSSSSSSSSPPLIFLLHQHRNHNHHHIRYHHHRSLSLPPSPSPHKPKLYLPILLFNVTRSIEPIFVTRYIHQIKSLNKHWVLHHIFPQVSVMDSCGYIPPHFLV